MNKKLFLGVALLAASMGANAQKAMSAPAVNTVPWSATVGEPELHGGRFAQDTHWVAWR